MSEAKPICTKIACYCGKHFQPLWHKPTDVEAEPSKPKSAFTDDDLKRLKTMVLNCEAFYGMNTGALPIRLSDLLARLEAAEKVIATEPNWIGPGRIAYEKWLASKSAGKSEDK